MTPIQWFKNGDRGLSSEALVAHIFGLPTYTLHDPTAHPWDPADFARCRMAVELIGCQDILHKAASLSPAWARIIEAWPSLCDIMDREAPDWRNHKGTAPETYKLLRKATIVG